MDYRIERPPDRTRSCPAALWGCEPRDRRSQAAGSRPWAVCRDAVADLGPGVEGHSSAWLSWYLGEPHFLGRRWRHVLLAAPYFPGYRSFDFHIRPLSRSGYRSQSSRHDRERRPEWSDRLASRTNDPTRLPRRDNTGRQLSYRSSNLAVDR